MFINADQYFEHVPQIAWNFHIGGYQRAQKWLKDRRGRALSFEDISHYQKIVKIMTETDRIMRDTFWLGVYPGLSREMVEHAVQAVCRSAGAACG